MAVLDKPQLTPPELRRKKSEIDGKLKALDEEQARRLDELSGDDVKLDDPRWKSADEYRDKREPLIKLSSMYSSQIVAADKWEIADTAINAGAEDTANERGMDQDLPHNDPKNTRKGRLGYSLLKAMRSNLADIANRPDWKLSGLELEVHDELNKKRIAQDRPSARGIMIPHDLPIDRRAAERFARNSNLSTQFQREDRSGFDTTAGGGSIPTILDTTMIELLRARMVTIGMGAKSLTDMQGLFAIPRQSTASTFYMVTQGASVTASNATIDQVPFSPHTGGVQTQYTRQLLEQTNQDAEMFVREDQAAVVARGVETAGLNGQGSNGFPLGLLQNIQIPVYALGTNGAAPSWTQLVSMQAYLSYHNADVGSLGYVTDALTRGTLQTTAKIGSTFPIYLWNTEAPAAPVAGFPCGITNLLPQNIVKGSGTNLHAMIYGNWNDMIYAFWSGMDTIVDPYTQAANGGVVITTLQDFDVNIRHPQSFANCADIISGITAPII